MRRLSRLGLFSSRSPPRENAENVKASPTAKCTTGIDNTALRDVTNRQAPAASPAAAKPKAAATTTTTVEAPAVAADSPLQAPHLKIPLLVSDKSKGSDDYVYSGLGDVGASNSSGGRVELGMASPLLRRPPPPPPSSDLLRLIRMEDIGVPNCFVGGVGGDTLLRVMPDGAPLLTMSLKPDGTTSLVSIPGGCSMTVTSFDGTVAYMDNGMKLKNRVDVSRAAFEEQRVRAARDNPSYGTFSRLGRHVEETERASAPLMSKYESMK